MSEASLRFFSTEFKVRLLLRLQAGESVAALARENGIAPQLIYDWRKSYLASGAAGLNRKRGRRVGWRAPPSARPASSESASAEVSSNDAGRADELTRAKTRIAELERVIGRQQADLHFFREALRLWDATSRSGGAPASTRSSKK
ncbi:MAG TPA: helix-turn-helix domain-containing protein [Roseiarcus sp.]|nr:helix-turn-helix domain-containing protein [Roseiarcus sp.]